MDDAVYLAVHRQEADALAAAAVGHLDARIPAIEDWTVRDVVVHMADGNHWATLMVRDGLNGRDALDATAVVTATHADDDEDALFEWLRTSTDALEAALVGIEAGQVGWTLLGREEPLTFWRRRRAHEVLLHRWDVDSARTQPAPIDLALALDGIDEVFDTFAPRLGGRVTGEGQTLHLHATDDDLPDGTGEWTATFTPDGVTWERGHAKGDAAVRGPASDLLLLLWNRIPAGRLEVFGDAAVLDRWATQFRV